MWESTVHFKSNNLLILFCELQKNFTSSSYLQRIKGIMTFFSAIIAKEIKTISFADKNGRVRIGT